MWLAVISEDKSNPTSQQPAIDDPTSKDVEDTIGKMDGDVYCTLYIMKDEDVGMEITGGYKNRFFCQVMFAPDDVAILKNPTESNKHQEKITRHGAADYPKDEVVGTDVILKAAKTYAERGALDDELHWDRFC